MLGANCFVFGYTNDIATFRVIGGEDEFKKSWRAKLEHVIKEDSCV